MIRPAVEADAAAIAALQARALLHAFGELVDPEQLLADATDAAGWRALVARGGALAWVQDGQVAGVAAVGAAGDAGELLALHVDPPAQGAGVGGALLAAALDELRRAGFAQVAAWVLEPDGLARSFLERRGWHAAAAPSDNERWAPAVRYRTRL